MSSGVESGGIVAAAVALPFAAAFGAGWLAWQGGRLLIEANRAVDRQIEEKKRQMEEAERQRKTTAISAHNQLINMCEQIAAQLEKDMQSCSTVEYTQMQSLKMELKQITSEYLPEEIAKIESVNALGYMKLDSIISRQQKLASIKLSGTIDGLYDGLSVADLMADLRIAFSAMQVRETVGTDVRAIDPNVMERIKLDERLAEVTGRIMTALAYVEDMTGNYGLSDANRAWFHSCFDGVDMQIKKLCNPSISNADLKRGIRRLEELMAQYDMLLPDIEQKQAEFSALYSVYVDAAKALGEPILSMKHFKTADKVKEQLLRLEKKAEKAKECAELYNLLGESAYMCYAWDQELQALGYSVRQRKAIKEMMNHLPDRAKLGEKKLPFYEWNEEELTQIYSVSEECSLQLIVHKDGAVSMQMLAENGDDDTTRQVQKTHCEQLQKLHKALRENWFLLYDYEETMSPDIITSVAEWKATDSYAWKDDVLVTEERKSEERVAQKEMAQR